MLAVAPSRDRRLRAGWVALLERHEFDHLAHLTFKFERASIRFAFERLDNWSNGLARLAQRPIAWAAFPEYTHADLVHLHALLVGTGDVPVETMTERWRTRNGRAKIEPFEEGRGGERYITKAISARYSEGDFSSNFERVVRRRDGVG